VAGADIPDGVETECWLQPSLDLRFNGVSLIGGTVDETMNILEVVLNPNGEELTSANVTISSRLESEALSLSEIGGNWQNTFERMVADNPELNDKILQHSIEGDSIIVVWRNPDIPLDTVRIAVPFKVGRTLEIEAAYYFDTDADGFIDSIYVDMNTDSLLDGDLEEMRDWITLPDSRKFIDARFVNVPGGFAIIVHENGTEPRTAVNERDVLKIDYGIISHGGMVNAGEVFIEDRIAPVIIKATVDKTDSLHDKLNITFSEPVSPVSSFQPFLFETAGGAQYYVAVHAEGDPLGNAYTFVVDSVAQTVVQRKGDSVWINTAGNVSDTKNNIQQNPANRRVDLQVKSAPFTVEPLTLNNPMQTDRGITPELRQSIDYAARIYSEVGVTPPSAEEFGPMVIVRPRGTSIRQIGTLTGTISVFDVVKNVIVDKSPMVFDQATKQLLYVWNGRNRNNKLVANGTYSAIIEISDGEGFHEVTSTRLGVKR
jgi:hypothetical protein